MLNVCKLISCGRPIMIIVSGTLRPVPVLCVLRFVLGFVFTFLCSSSISIHLVAVPILFVSGVLVVSLLLLWMVN